MKIAFFGYDYSADVLKGLLQDGHTLTALFTFPCDGIFNFNDQVVEIAKNLNAPISPGKPTKEAIKELEVDLFLSCGYPYKIPCNFKNEAYAINVHPSLLPRGRGLMPSPWIIMKEPDVAGFTIHKLTNDFDAGDILYQKPIALNQKSTVNDYADEIAEKLPDILSEIANNLPAFWAKATPQDESTASYFPPPTDKMRLLDWSQPIEELDKIARAFGTFGCIAVIDGKPYAIYEHEIIKKPPREPPGTTIKQENQELKTSVSDGYFIMKRYDPL